MTEFMIKTYNAFVFGHTNREKLQNFADGKLDGIKIEDKTYYRDDVEKIFIEL